MTARTATLGLYALLTLIVLLPVLAVQVPGLGDSINHVARMHVLLADAASPLRRFYTVHWTLSPYLAMDAVVPVLAQVMPLLIAARVFLAACLLMPIAGVAALQWAASGRIGLVPAAAFLLSQNYLLALGFLNFLFMAGLAVMLFAAWIATQHWRRWPRTALFAVGVLILYLGHIFACLGYCLAVAGYEIARAARCRFRPWRTITLNVYAAAAQAIPALLLTPFFDRGQVALGEPVTAFGNVAVRLTAFASPVLFLADPVGAAVVIGTVAGVALVAWRIRLLPAVWPAALLLFAMSLAMPHQLAGVWGADLRLPLLACMVALGGAASTLSTRAGALVLAAITALTLAKSLDATWVLQTLDVRIAQTRRVLDALPRGSRLLVMDDTGLTDSVPQMASNAFWHIPLMAVIDRDAFVPYLFTGFMTVHPTETVSDAATPSGRPIDPAQLADGSLRADVARAIIPDGLGGRIYWYGWPQKFDFLLVQHAGTRSSLPSNLTMVAESEAADLYKISPGPAPSPPASR